MQRAAAGAPASFLLRTFAHAAIGAGMQVTLRVVGASEGRRLNARYRRRDYATNVLSFRYGPLHGDLVLCHPVIRKEARAQRKPLAAHYAHLVVHGMLHLRGYRHARHRDAARMEKAEVRLLRGLGFGDPYEVK